jgi:LEA14-like dessication related protein
MKLEIKIAFILAAIMLFATGVVQATIVDITAATNKPVYELGEEVAVFVIAYNPNPEPITLTGGFYFASYIMDGVYDWAEGKSAPEVILHVTINPRDYVTWDLTHGSYEMQEWPLTVGMHTVVGEVLAVQLIGDGRSTPVQFEVIPEPSTILLIVIGFIAFRARHCRISL